MLLKMFILFKNYIFKKNKNYPKSIEKIQNFSFIIIFIKDKIKNKFSHQKIILKKVLFLKF
jgi:hypothetical protein